MTYERPYGRSEGLADRLDAWAQRAGSDKTLPWIGLGIIADIRAAAATIRGEPLPDPDQDFPECEKTPEQLADEEFFEGEQWLPEQIAAAQSKNAEPLKLEYDL